MQSSPSHASRCFVYLGTAKFPPAVLPSSSISSLLVLLFSIPPPRSQPLVSVQRLSLICCCPGARISSPRQWSCNGRTHARWLHRLDLAPAQSSATPNRSPCFLSKNMIRGLKLSRQLVYSPRAASVSGPPLFLSKSYLISFQKRFSP